MSNKYDLTLQDTSGTSHGYVFHFSSDAQGPGVSSQPVDVPTVTTTSPTQSGGPYDVASANDYKRLALQSFHSGCAQASYDVEDASPSRFLESQNLDISEKGILKLGPGTTSYVTSPTAIQGVTGVGLGKVWQAFDPVATTTTALRYSTNNVDWTPVTFTGTDPTGNVVALCCDGTYMYAAFSGNNGIWRGTVADAWTEHVTDINGGDDAACLAACGGYIYVAKGDGTNVFEAGYVTAAGVYTAMSPSGVNNLVTAVACTTLGQFVYVVSSGGGVSRVYAMQKDPAGSDDTFQQVAQFPTGFIAKCAYGYLGTLYVGGYYDSYTTDRGVGAIYLVSGADMSLLTMVGDDETEDWRVLFLHGYEKHLYFVADNSVWKWSLEHGGYSHVATVAGGATPGIAAETWDLDFTMTAEPATGLTTAPAVDVLTIASAGGETTWGQSATRWETTDHQYSGNGATGDGNVYCAASDVTFYWAKQYAQQGTNGAYPPAAGGSVFVGQHIDPAYSALCFQGFIGFDTSSIPAGATITGATLYLAASAKDISATDFTLNVGSRAWGSLTAADWIVGAQLTATVPAVGSIAASSIPVGSAAGVAISTAAIVKEGTTQFILYSAHQASGDALIGHSYVFLYKSGTAAPPVLVVNYTLPATATPGTKTYTASSHAPATTGVSMEAKMGASIGSVATDGTVYPFTNYIYDGTYLSRMLVKQVKSGSDLTTYFGLLDSGSAWTWASGLATAQVNAKTLRMIVKNRVQNLYLNGTNILGPVNAPTSATAASFKFELGNTLNLDNWTFTLDNLKWTNDAAFDPSVGVTTSSGNLVACQDTLWVSATDVGIYKTNASENTTGWLTTSRSSSHMQTVSKFYRAIDVTTDQVLSGDQTIKAEWAIDGVWAGGSTLTATTSTATRHTWLVNTSGQDIQVKLTLGRTASLGPRVTGAAVRYLLPHYKKHSWMLNCTDHVMMKNRQRYDEDASDAIDFLFANADEYTVAATEYDSSIAGQIESVDFIDLQRRASPNNGYQGVVKVVYRELG